MVSGRREDFVIESPFQAAPSLLNNLQHYYKYNDALQPPAVREQDSDECIPNVARPFPDCLVELAGYLAARIDSLYC